MAVMSIPARLKINGNLNRLIELSEHCSATEAQNCFAQNGIHLTVVNGDFPLLANLSELSRKALPKRAVQAFLRVEDSLTPATV